MVKAENGCTPSPGLSADQGCTWNWMSGVSTCGPVRMNPVARLAAIAIGPDAEEGVFQRDPGLVEQAAHLVVERRLVAFEDQPRLQMVLQVAAHPGAVRQHVDAVLAQLFGLADPRGHQQMRRADGAGTRSPRCRP